MKTTVYKKLPAELRRFAQKQFFKRVIPCALLLTAIILSLVFWGDILVPTDNPIVRTIVYALLLPIPFFIFSVPRKLIDRSLYGTVTKVDIKSAMVTSLFWPARETYQKSTVYLHLLLDNGQTARHKAIEGVTRLKQHLDTYQTGDRVFHLYGSRYTIKLPTDADTTVQCAACGNISHKSSDMCEVCGRTLLKESKTI